MVYIIKYARAYKGDWDETKIEMDVNHKEIVNAGNSF